MKEMDKMSPKILSLAISVISAAIALVSVIVSFHIAYRAEALAQDRNRRDGAFKLCEMMHSAEMVKFQADVRKMRRPSFQLRTRPSQAGSSDGLMIDEAVKREMLNENIVKYESEEFQEALVGLIALLNYIEFGSQVYLAGEVEPKLFGACFRDFAQVYEERVLWTYAGLYLRAEAGREIGRLRTFEELYPDIVAFRACDRKYVLGRPAQLDSVLDSKCSQVKKLR